MTCAQLLTLLHKVHCVNLDFIWTWAGCCWLSAQHSRPRGRRGGTEERVGIAVAKCFAPAEGIGRRGRRRVGRQRWRLSRTGLVSVQHPSSLSISTTGQMRLRRSRDRCWTERRDRCTRAQRRGTLAYTRSTSWCRLFRPGLPRARRNRRKQLSGQT